ncbi:MAG TPA: oligopeptide/dipeptide ABC transporter ATP-binding protein [Alphaproteobacteria bacterium]|nr:oligopeptide/dipeptide ABC transporter ATP-binding protein [Alphaproteobacteria bacterium]
MSETLLELRDLKKYFPVTKGIIFQKPVGWVKAVDGVSYAIGAGETLGLVGESGCGKTTTSKLILMLEKPTGGTIVFRGQDIQALQGDGLKTYRRNVQAVFQDPFSSLNPRIRVGDIIAEPLVVNDAPPKAEVKARVRELLHLVGLNPGAENLFPHEFSGGQRQRIAIARALSLNPSLIVLDEPVSALDVSIRAQIMNLLQDLQQQFGLSYLLIAHDLAAVLHLSTNIAVMYLGKLVEFGTSDDLRYKPLHPYTQALFSAALPSHPDEQREEFILSGEVPSPLNPPSGCRFHPRCPFAKSVCSEVEPVLKTAAGGHQVACHLY